MSDSIKAIACSLVLPDKCDPQKYSDGVGSQPVAIGRCVQEYTNIWTCPTLGDDGSVMAAAFFRDVLCEAIIYQRNPGAGVTYDYVLQDENGSDIWTNGPFEYRKINQTLAKAVGTIQQHGPNLYPAQDDLCDNYVWVDTDTTGAGALLFTCNDTTIVPIYASFTVYRCDSRKAFQYTSFDTGSMITFGGVSYFLLQVFEPGYYRTEILNQTNAVLSTSIEAISSGLLNDFWGHKASKTYEQNIQNFDSIRIDAVGVEWRNSGAAAFINGKVAAVQYGRAKDFASFAVAGINSIYQTVTEANGNWSKNFDKGMQTFIRPTQLSDFKLRKPLSTPGLGSLGFTGGFPISKKSGWIMLAASIAPGNINPGLTQMRLALGLEYETDDELMNTEVSDHTPIEWMAAIRLVNQMPQFYDQGLTLGTVISQ